MCVHLAHDANRTCKTSQQLSPRQKLLIKQNRLLLSKVCVQRGPRHPDVGLREMIDALIVPRVLETAVFPLLDLQGRSKIKRWAALRPSGILYIALDRR